MIINQGYLFLIFTLDGVIIGLLFDLFRILRKSFKTSNFVTYLEDILFWILTGVLILYSIFTFNNGEIRFFFFLGIVIGIVLYMLLLSNYIINTSVFLIGIIKKIIAYPLTIILNICKKLFFKPIKFLFINFKNLTKNMHNLPKKLQNKKDFADKSRII